MALRDVDLFQPALGLPPPWEVESCEFSPEKKRLDIRLTFPRGSVFVCPECGRTYVAGGETCTKIAYSNEENPYTKARKALNRQGLLGANVDLAG